MYYAAWPEVSQTWINYGNFDRKIFENFELKYKSLRTFDRN